MQIAILGPLEVRDDAGARIEVAGARLRSLLTRLALSAGTAVGVTVLIDCVWGTRPPADGMNALQTLVSRLRRLLGDSNLVAQSPAGYRLALDPDQVDAHRFERLAADGSRALRAGLWDEAARASGKALALWRGPALVDATETGDAFTAPAARLADLRLATVVDQADADLHRGAPTGPMVAQLEAQVAEHPLHEGLTDRLMRALAAAGRQADALHAYERIREQLADELGVDPGPQLQSVHLAVLRGELGAAGPITRRTNLKAQLTSFVGREAEVTRIGKALEQNRLVTLVGPGGAGKTRLASEAAARVLDTAPDGIWLVELAPLTAGADVPQAVLAALGLREANLLDRRTTLPAREAMPRLLESLADKRSVVVLDNCEHLVDASARLADQLLAACPGLRILATSREPLGIFGEVLLAVPPLGQPTPTASASEALEYPAVRLFADRASAVVRGFDVDDANVAAVIEVVRRLDGLPLAIELAAARLRTMPLPEIAARLDDRFRLLTGGSRTALPRHRTLRAVVEWSWDLLTPAERAVIEQLAVFPSGVTRASAAAVCAIDQTDVDDLLGSLIDKSLLQPVDGGRRMRMLETIREFGSERLAERGELADVRARHAAHFAEVLAEAEPHLTRADQLPWFALLDNERDNIVAALRYRCDVGDAEGALQIATSLGAFAMMLGYHAEITSWVTDALAVPGPADSQLRTVARALLALNAAATGSPDDHGADDHGAGDHGAGNHGAGDPEALRKLANELADVQRTSTPLLSLLRPTVAFLAEERELTARYLAEASADPDEWAQAASRMLHATLAENDGDIDTMRREGTLAVAAFQRLGERWGLANGLRVIGQVDMLVGDLDASAEAFERALDLTAELNSHDDEGFLLGRLAELELRRGNLDRARGYVTRANERAEESGSVIEAVLTLTMQGGVEFAAGNRSLAGEFQREAVRRLAALPRENPARGHIRALVLCASVRMHVEDGDFATAVDVAAEAYRAGVGTRDMPLLASVGVAISALRAELGDALGAAVTLGASARLRGAEDPTSPDIARVTATLRDRLGEARLAHAHAAGCALDRDAAIERLAPPGHVQADAATSR